MCSVKTFASFASFITFITLLYCVLAITLCRCFLLPYGLSSWLTRFTTGFQTLLNSVWQYLAQILQQLLQCSNSSFWEPGITLETCGDLAIWFLLISWCEQYPHAGLSAVCCFDAKEVWRPSGCDVMWRRHQPMPYSHWLWDSHCHVGIFADRNSAAETWHRCVSFAVIVWLNCSYLKMYIFCSWKVTVLYFCYQFFDRLNQNIFLVYLLLHTKCLMSAYFLSISLVYCYYYGCVLLHLLLYFIVYSLLHSVVVLCCHMVNEWLLLYEGHSINKLQNSTFLLVFQILKNRNIRFVGNFILSSSCEFYYDDVTVTSFINIKYGNVAPEILP